MKVLHSVQKGNFYSEKGAYHFWLVITWSGSEAGEEQ